MRILLLEDDHRLCGSFARSLRAAGELSRLRNAWGDLNRTEREVLALSAVGETTYAEMAEALDIPVGTVRSRIHRARARLATHLQHPQADPQP